MKYFFVRVFKLIIIPFFLIVSLGCQRQIVQYTLKYIAGINNFSGTYNCRGVDAKEGELFRTVTMEIQPNHSDGDYVSYEFILDDPQFGLYKGFASANGMDVAIYFALDDKANQDYGVGVAKFTRSSKGTYKFHKFYYKPGYEDGKTGIENCIRQDIRQDETVTIQNKIKQVELAEVLPIEQVKSLFQQAHSKATAEGLSKFKFTNKAGKTKQYLTGLSLFQQAYAEATAEGLSKFKFTNKAGETKEYSTNLTPLSPAK